MVRSISAFLVILGSFDSLAADSNSPTAAQTTQFVTSTPAAQLGIPATPLHVSKWIRGKPVNVLAQTNANHVVVFWESGCPACRGLLDSLSQLEAEFQTNAIVFVAISTEDPETVEAYLKANPAKGEFAIATDDKRKTHSAYMVSYSATTLPHAFIINPKGALVWHRNPGAGLREALVELVENRYDIEAEKRALHALELQTRYFDLCSTNAADAGPLGKHIFGLGEANPWLLNSFSWKILTDSKLTNRDLDLAMKASQFAYYKTHQTNSAFADTYARALFEVGHVSEAIKTQKRALELCTDQTYRPMLQEALQKYEQKGRPESN
jgi:thiol-disulfide isomerase/thioredoxin